jgi:DNA mismatch endonuclease, patch repair protein
MTDVHDPVTRSYNMSRIRGKNTNPEITVRKFLHSRGLRFRIHSLNLPGKPDIVLPKYNTVLFVNGCFWHGHEGCKYFVLPKTRSDWWKNKIIATKNRDLKKYQELKDLGWTVLVVWECELKQDALPRTMTRIMKKINSGTNT